MDDKLPKNLIAELDSLVVKLSSHEVEEREMALRRLVDYETTQKTPVKVLISMADSPNMAVTMYAISALGRNGTPPGVKKLLELLETHKGGNILLEESIIDALGETRSITTSQTLMELLGIRVGWKGNILGRKLSKKKKDAEAKEAKTRELLTLALVRALEKVGDPKNAELMGDFLDHDDPLVRWHTIQIINDCNIQKFNAKLKSLMENDDNDIVKEAASIALDRFGSLPANLNN